MSDVFELTGNGIAASSTALHNKNAGISRFSKATLFSYGAIMVSVAREKRLIITMIINLFQSE